MGGVLSIPIQKQADRYTPALVIVSNLDALSLNGAHFALSGRLCTVWLHAQCEPTAGTVWTFRCGLPFGAEFDDAHDIIGAGATHGALGPVEVEADITNNDALIRGLDGTTADGLVVCSFSYLVPV